MLAMLSSGASAAPRGTEAQGGAGMSKNIVMLHGASEGGWCFDSFRTPFEAKGWTVHAPDLTGHGKDKDDAKTKLKGVGLAEYYAELEPLLKSFATPPVLLGHSMGGLLAQQLAASGLASALVLISPAPHSGILPATDDEKNLAQGFMTIPSFWTTVISPDFDLACIYSLNCVPKDRQREVFDKFGPESGLAYFQMFFWMVDTKGAAKVETAAVRCPVLCVVGAEDHLVAPATVKATAQSYSQAVLWQEPGHGHMLPVEPGAAEIARRIEDWIPV